MSQDTILMKAHQMGRTVTHMRYFVEWYMDEHGIGASAVDLIPDEIKKLPEGMFSTSRYGQMYDMLSPWAAILELDMMEGLEKSRRFWDHMGVKKYVKPVSPFRTATKFRKAMP